MIWFVLFGEAVAKSLLIGRAGVRRIRSLFRGDGGMTTAEYAIGTVAAAAFAGLLYTVVTSDSVTAALTSLIERAMESGGF